jgi:hypothetical protein
VKWALLFFLGWTGVAIVAVCIAVLFVRHRLGRHHRVDPAVPTDAPLTWLVDPRTAARLHRRLARVGSTCDAIVRDHQPRSRLRRKGEPPTIVALAREVSQQAVGLDRQLARLSMLAAPARRAPLASLVRSVAEIESAGARLVSLSSELVAPPVLGADHPGVFDLTARLERLAAAHRELLDVDAEAGLTTHPLPAPPLGSPQARPR